MGEKEELERKLREALGDNDIIKRAQSQLEKNNELLLQKLDQSNFRINELTSSKSSTEFTLTLEIDRLRNELAIMQDKAQDLESDLKRKYEEESIEKGPL